MYAAWMFRQQTVHDVAFTAGPVRGPSEVQVGADGPRPGRQDHASAHEATPLSCVDSGVGRIRPRGSAGRSSPG